MSTEKNKVVARKFYELFETGNLKAAEAIVAEDFVNLRAIPGQTPGLAGLKEVIQAFRAGVPDIKFTIEEQVAEGDKVASRYSAKCTHQGDFLGVPGTGKSLNFTGLVIHRIIDGKIQNAWLEFDMFGVMRQMGTIPAPGGNGK
jgi:steroid delta-isomerase-like uncharacterized protein